MTDQETMFDLWQEELQIRKEEELVKSIAEQFEFNAKEVEERVMESSAKYIRQRDALYYPLPAEPIKVKELKYTDHECFTPQTKFVRE